MTLENEIREEIKRIEREMKELDEELNDLNSRITQIQMIMQKKERDMKILKSAFGEGDRKEIQTSLAKVVK